MFKNDIEFFILCAILLILFLVVGLAYARMMRTNRRRDEELSRLMYSLLKKTRELDDDYLSLKEQNQQYANDIKRLQFPRSFRAKERRINIIVNIEYPECYTRKQTS